MGVVTAKAVVEAPDRALAGRRPAGLRPVRQRHDLPGAAPAHGRRRPGHAGCAWAWGSCRCSSRRARRASRRRSRATTAAGRPRSGPGSRTSRWRACRASRAGTWPPCRLRAAARIEAAPPRRPFPEGWTLDLQAHPRGRIVYLRRTDAAGAVELLGRRFEVDRRRGRTGWSGRRWTSTPAGSGSIALRRREPDHQPLLREVAYKLPRRRFKE